MKSDIKSGKSKYGKASHRFIASHRAGHYDTLLLLVLPIYLGMWLGVQPTHIHPYIRKSRLLLETNGCINELCLQWTPYMPGITVHDCSVAWKRKPAARPNSRVLLYALVMT